MYKIFITSIFLILFSCKNPQYSSQDKDPVPYNYTYSVEELKKLYSDEIISNAHVAMNKLHEVNDKGIYKADFKSLNTHETPEWYLDAKLCIFYDWGIYSVAGYGEKGWSRARYPDWYLHHMHNQLKSYHDSVWGEDFERDDFIPLFTAEDFDASELVNLVKQSGAKYLVPFSKHHDGFCLWQSGFTFRDAADMTPQRDIIAEIVEACEKEGIYHGFYFSVEEYEYPMIDNNGELTVRYWSDGMAPDNAGIVQQAGEVYGPFISEIHNRMLSGKIPVTDFIDEYIVPQAREYIDKYDPDILWFDGEWQRNADYYKTPAIVAYFYNQAENRKEVAANDRFGVGTREHSGDFYTSETDEVVDRIEYPWEENRSMSESYGYNRMDSAGNYLTADELIQMLVRIVSKGGNLNLIVNPDGTGKIPKIQKDLLYELGEWLKVNGEAIYGTRPYEVTADNTQLGQPVWYTMSKDSTYGYAIVFDWPKSETFICPGADIKWETEVYMLGYDQPLDWVDTGSKAWGLSAKIPDKMLHDSSNRPSKYAWVLKFEYDKDNLFGN